MTAARILLVDDEVLITMAVEAALEDAGYEVTTVSNGDTALALFERDPHKFDCLVTDVRMPGTDGWKLANRVRELRPGVPVIYMTGDSEVEWQAKGVADSNVLAKPFNLKEAVALVVDAVGTSQSQR